MSTRNRTRPLGASHTRPGRKSESTTGANRRIGKLLLAELKRLEGIRAAMTIEGFDEEAGSLETTIADLRWQYEELKGSPRAGGRTDPKTTPERASERAAMRRAYLKSVGLRWLGGLTAVIGVGSLELIRYEMASQPFGQAVTNNSPLLILFAGLFLASLVVLVRRPSRLGWISYLIGAAAGPLILWGLGSYLEGPALAWVSLFTVFVVGFTHLPGLARSMREGRR